MRIFWPFPSTLQRSKRCSVVTNRVPDRILFESREECEASWWLSWKCKELTGKFESEDANLPVSSLHYQLSHRNASYFSLLSKRKCTGKLAVRFPDRLFVYLAIFSFLGINAIYENNLRICSCHSCAASLKSIIRNSPMLGFKEMKHLIFLTWFARPKFELPLRLQTRMRCVIAIEICLSSLYFPSSVKSNFC